MQQRQPQQPQLGCFEQLWKPIIRPPRHEYKLKDLGNPTQLYGPIVVKRVDFSITNQRKQVLECSLFEPVRVQDKSHPCIIYLHGNSSSRLEAYTIIEHLIPFNIAICAIDLSGSGHSEGTYISLGWFESQDVQCLIEYLRSNKPYITKIGLWGRSMGSVTGIIAASQNDSINVLVCDSPFSNLTQLVKELAATSYNIPGCCFSCFWCLIKHKIYKEAQLNVDDLDIIKIIQTLNVETSIMFLSAKQDTLVPVKHPQMLYDKFRGQNKQIQTFDGVHNSKRPADVMKETVKFVVNQLGKDAWSLQESARDHRQIQINTRSFQVDELTQILPQN